MKNIFLVFFYSICVLSVDGQVNWFPAGAQWHYQFSSIVGGGLTTLEVLAEDTLIGNQVYKKIISKTLVDSSPEPLDTFKEVLYVYEANKVVFGYDKYLGGIKLYDFNASIGDTLEMYFGGFSPYPFIVDSIGEMVINDSLLAFQEIRFPHPYLTGEFLEMKVIEGMGSINSHLFHNRTVIYPLDFPFYYFRCYEDPIIGLINLSHNQVDCDYIEGITSVEDAIIENPSLFPNPTTDFVFLKMKVPFPMKIFVVDMLGAERIVQSSTNQDILEIDFRQLENGMFLILGQDEYGAILFTEKVIKCAN